MKRTWLRQREFALLLMAPVAAAALLIGTRFRPDMLRAAMRQCAAVLILACASANTFAEEASPNQGAVSPNLQVQEIYGRGNTFRWTQFWYQQLLFDNLVDVKLGRMGVDEDFMSFSWRIVLNYEIKFKL